MKDTHIMQGVYNVTFCFRRCFKNMQIDYFTGVKGLLRTTGVQIPAQNFEATSRATTEVHQRCSRRFVLIF
jgi:hypothetical protein